MALWAEDGMGNCQPILALPQALCPALDSSPLHLLVPGGVSFFCFLWSGNVAVNDTRPIK